MPKKLMSVEQAIRAIREAGSKIDQAIDCCSSVGLDPNGTTVVKRTVHNPFFSLSIEHSRTVSNWELFHRL